MVEEHSSYYARIGLRAAQRAAEKVILKAHQENTPIPVWDGEKVQYIIPPLPNKTLHQTSR